MGRWRRGCGPPRQHFDSGRLAQTDPFSTSPLILFLMKTALYHQTGKAPLQLKVVKEHTNGTVDLADAAGKVVVSECVVVARQEPEVGSCTLMEDEDAIKAARALRQKANAAKKAAGDAAKAAKAAEGKANHAELLQAAKAADEEAAAAEADAVKAESEAK